MAKVPVFSRGEGGIKEKVYAVLQDHPYEAGDEFLGVFTTIEKAEKFALEYIEEATEEGMYVAVHGNTFAEDYWTSEVFILETNLQ